MCHLALTHLQTGDQEASGVGTRAERLYQLCIYRKGERLEKGALLERKDSFINRESQDATHVGRFRQGKRRIHLRKRRSRRPSGYVGYLRIVTRVPYSRIVSTRCERT